MATERHHRPLRVIALVCVTLAAVFGLIPARAVAAPSVNGWSLAPTPQHGAQRDVLQYSVAQNQVIHDSVTLSNPSNKPVTVTLYAADAYNTVRGGAFAFALPTARKTGAGAWISVAVDRLTVPPGKQANIPITVHVPNRATPGSVAAGIVAQDVNVQKGTSHGNVSVGVRYGLGVRVYMQVVGPTHPGLGVVGVSVGHTRGGSKFFGGGKSHIGYTVVNTGNLRVDATATARVVNEFGHTVHTFPKHNLPALLPGAKVQLDDPWNAPWAGRFRVEVTVTSNGVVAHGQGVLWEFPLILLIAALLVLGLGAWWWFWLRKRPRGRHGRRNKRPGPDDGGPGDGGPSDDLPDDDLPGDEREPVDAVAAASS